MTDTPQPPQPIYPAQQAEHTGGTYRPDAKLLQILAQLVGVEDLQQASAQQRQSIHQAVERIHDAGLSPDAIGLVPEARVEQLQGLKRTSARTVRNRDKGFPRPVVTYRLWSEVDVRTYLDWRDATRRPNTRPSTRSRMARQQVDGAEN